jgi:hypothetical protein
MHYVPVEPRVMLIGDVFEKLSCVYNPYKPAPKEWKEDLGKTYFVYDTNTKSDTYLQYVKADPQPTNNTYKQKKYYVSVGQSIYELVETLRKKLNLYKVDQQDNGKKSVTPKSDDVLLTLENKDSDSATIRIRYDIDKTSEPPSKNDYRIYRTVTNAKTGIINTEVYDLASWVKGELTATKLNLDDDWTISSIGTLGAYLCLTKDETIEENLEDYGIKLLEEKQVTYTKIFITQTEGYMSQEGYQCVAQDEPPDSEIAEGTKWLDTDSDPLTLHKYQSDSWVAIQPSDDDTISADASNSANNERYLENYNKLKAVQSALLKKQKIATYMLNGFAEDTMYLKDDNINANTLLKSIVMYFITEDRDVIVTKYNATGGYDLSGASNGTILVAYSDDDLHVEIKELVGNQWTTSLTVDIPSITISGYSSKYKVMTFKIDTDTENEYAVYVNNGTPYIAYARSQGVCLAKMNYLKTDSDMNTFFTEGELVRLSPFIREDEFSDQNFLLTGYESEEEQMYIKQELLKAGDEELKKICQPKLSFSATMGNILAIPEFAPLRKQFQLGNFVSIEIRNGYTKKARLLDVQINFDTDNDFSCTFGDLISTKSQIDKHAELLQQAVSAGKSVAANKSSWQKAVDTSTKLDQAINDGLKDAALSIGSAHGQSIVWDQYGIRGRKLREGSTDQYEDQQFALINNKLVFTDDNWRTSRAVVGEFEIDIDNTKQKMYGLMADAVVGGYLQGTDIVGGSLKIGSGDGNYFEVLEDGTVTITQGGQEKYASKSAIQTIDNAYRFYTVLEYDNSTVFADPTDECTITCHVYDYDTLITNKILGANGTTFTWTRSSSTDDTEWNKQNANKTTNTITIKPSDVTSSAQFFCTVQFDEKLLINNS